MGLSEAAKDGYDLSNLAEDIHQLVLSMGISKVKVVGHDWGGAVGAVYAMRYPNEVTRLAFLEPVRRFSLAQLYRSGTEEESVVPKLGAICYQIATKNMASWFGAESGFSPFTSHLNNLIFACRVTVRSGFWALPQKTTSGVFSKPVALRD